MDLRETREGLDCYNFFFIVILGELGVVWETHLWYLGECVH